MTSPLTTAQQVRLRIQDLPKYADYTRYSDGTATRYVLDHANITGVSAYVAPGGTAWSATGCTVNTSGYVDFSAVLSANSALRFTYNWTVFSDDEIGHFTAVGGNVPGAALQALRALRFDGLKRARWMSPDGAQYDDTNALTQMRDMESALKTELQEDLIAGGGMYSWGAKQEDYT